MRLPNPTEIGFAELDQAKAAEAMGKIG